MVSLEIGLANSEVISFTVMMYLIYRQWCITIISMIVVDTQSVASTYESEIIPTLPYVCPRSPSNQPPNIKSLVVVKVYARSSKSDHERTFVLHNVPRVSVHL